MILERAFNMADLAVGQVELFFLAFFRVSFVIFFWPIFGEAATPSRIKVGIAFFLTVLLFPLLSHSDIIIHPGPAHLFVLVIQECVIGALMGLVGMLLFAFVELGGGLISQDIGLGMVSLMDPATGDQSQAIGLFLVMVFSLIFLVTGGHLYFIRAISDSFQYIPLGGFTAHWDRTAMLLSATISQCFVAGLRLAAPVMVSSLVMMIALALITRAMPSLNVWVISVPIKVVVGLLLVIFALPLLYQLFEQYFVFIQEQTTAMMRLMGPAHVR